MEIGVETSGCQLCAGGATLSLIVFARR